MLSGNTLEINVEKAEKIGVHFKLECLNSASAETLLKEYREGQYYVKLDFKNSYALCTLIDKNTNKKVPEICYLKHEYSKFHHAIYKTLTFSEAQEKWGLSKSTLRKAVYDNRFKEGEIRKSGNTWLVTEEAMKRLYGEPE